ncbi:cytochrome b/b6 domain-containing protein [Aestuariivirga litoralis]|uniref:cytochrome b/b6 domain-containing protein n=1 Tax=Aestuariivirga litoralis TaxID=2650924 RepID=UPI0018C691AE|nr:cytochrome b/b6 domain-containing protein [Aestuariivirga litoralis]MBG1230747.1 cytochrome B [Aestuariivirga litoralis]
MKKVRVWDPFVRLFHWSVVISLTANAFFTKGNSEFHHWIGYFVATLIVARVIWGFVGVGYARFTSFPPSIAGSIEQLSDISVGRRKPHTGHTPLGALMIYNLLITLLIICVSGYLMTTDAFWGDDLMEETHRMAVTWAEFSAIIHIVAVIFESFRTRVNLPRSMVTGYKNLP